MHIITPGNYKVQVINNKLQIFILEVYFRYKFTQNKCNYLIAFWLQMMFPITNSIICIFSDKIVKVKKAEGTDEDVTNKIVNN